MSTASASKPSKSSGSNHSVGVRPADYRVMRELAQAWGVNYTRLIGAMAIAWKRLPDDAKLDSIRLAGRSRN